jgi:hypothetical protein
MIPSIEASIMQQLKTGSLMDVLPLVTAMGRG